MLAVEGLRSWLVLCRNGVPRGPWARRVCLAPLKRGRLLLDGEAVRLAAYVPADLADRSRSDDQSAEGLRSMKPVRPIVLLPVSDWFVGRTLDCDAGWFAVTKRVQSRGRVFERKLLELLNVGGE